MKKIQILFGSKIYILQEAFQLKEKMRKWENDKIRINKNTNNTDNYRKSQTNVANFENFIPVYDEFKEELNENKVKN